MTKLILIGMGPGPVDLLTLKAWELLASGSHRVMIGSDFADSNSEAPLPGPSEVAETMAARGIPFEPVDSTDAKALAGLLMDAAIQAPCIYAAPGSILARPETIEILTNASGAGIELEIVPSLSAADLLPASDPITGTHAGAEAVRSAAAFARLVSVMARLRAPGGCPWDAEQTHTSLAIHLLEEAHETLDAIDAGDHEGLAEELGDLLLQIVFHAEIALESGRFGISDVVEDLVDKLVERHPHVFGDVQVGGSADVVKNWEALKSEHKKRKSPGEGIPKGLPALVLAHKVQRRMQGAGAPVAVSLERVEKLTKRARKDLTEELVGEMLFQVAALAETRGIDPEGALRRTSNSILEPPRSGL
ncbi:MAG TPA: MazG family protein [Actinomycetota bacterium]|nr:MazG family protein [Actinomycetota bacterium]